MVRRQGLKLPRLFSYFEKFYKMASNHQLWRRAILPFNSTVHEAIINLEHTEMKIVLFVDENGLFRGTVCDGDIRRGLIKGISITDNVSLVINLEPVTVTPITDPKIVKTLMLDKQVRQIPIIDEKRCVVGLHLWDDLNLQFQAPNSMVIMAGGLGKRLLPHTKDCPKPMLPVKGRPMLEHILSRAKNEGFSKFFLSVNYLGHIIKDYFGNGDRFGVEIQYLSETKPLGTVGALSLISSVPSEPFIVTNCDVVSDISYRKMLEFHQNNAATATMAVRVHEWESPFGVVQTDGFKLIGFEEKPIYRNYINAGIYVLNPTALSLLNGDPCDMPELFERLRLQNEPTVVYPMHEDWLDVGRPDDLRLANTKKQNAIK